MQNSDLLSHPNFDLEFVLYTDGSEYAVGGVLGQHLHSDERITVIAYFSKSLLAA